MFFQVTGLALALFATGVPIARAARRVTPQQFDAFTVNEFRQKIPADLIAGVRWQRRTGRRYLSFEGVPRDSLSNRLKVGLYRKEYVRQGGKRPWRGPRVGLSLTFSTGDLREHQAVGELIQNLSRDMAGNVLYVGGGYRDSTESGEFTIVFPPANVPLSPDYRYGIELLRSLLRDYDASIACEAVLTKGKSPEIDTFTSGLRRIYTSVDFVTIPRETSAPLPRIHPTNVTCGSDLLVSMW